MIRFEHVSKTFQTKNGPFDALKDVSFEIEKGDIYGVIGYSGAGKSTLIRMVNALETPTSGNVWVEEKDIGTLNQKELRNLRKGIGMIFQQFNLLESKTIYDNVAIALKLNGVSKKDMEKRVTELLDFVELSDKKYSYPGQLSGGQKQRVGIARALANNPSILLCDEATSALDNESERHIQKSLEELSRNRTTITIAHRLSTIRSADEIIVIDGQGIVERGNHRELLEKNACTPGIMKCSLRGWRRPSVPPHDHPRDALLPRETCFHKQKRSGRRASECTLRRAFFHGFSTVCPPPSRLTSSGRTWLPASGRCPPSGTAGAPGAA